MIGADGTVVDAVSFGSAHASDAGTVFPDPVLRTSDGRIHWLSKTRRTIMTFDPDGSFVATKPITAGTPFFFRATPRNAFTVFTVAADAELASYLTIGGRQEAPAPRPGWLVPAKRWNDFAATFFFETADDRKVELLANVPFVRFDDGSIRDLGPCSALPLARGRGGSTTVAGFTAGPGEMAATIRRADLLPVSRPRPHVGA